MQVQKSSVSAELLANTDTVRAKEFHCQPLYEKRAKLLKKIPDFWPSVFSVAPDEIRSVLTPDDLALVAHLKSFSVERHQIESESKGEPRSIRFTFEFGPNEYMENTKLVKDFEYQPQPGGWGSGNIVSKPVPIKWKSKKKDLTKGFLDAAVELYNAEEALKLGKGDKIIDVVDREALWQHEKLREKIAKLNEADWRNMSFFTWFGFRGVVDPKPTKQVDGDRANRTDDDEEEAEYEAGRMLEVEIFPQGEVFAEVLGEELWPNALDLFMEAQGDMEDEGFDVEDDDDDDDNSSNDEAPELVLAEEEDTGRPRKKQRKG